MDENGFGADEVGFASRLDVEFYEESAGRIQMQPKCALLDVPGDVVEFFAGAAGDVGVEAPVCGGVWAGDAGGD